VSSFSSDQELIIRGERLHLVATTLEHIEAELQGPACLGPLLGVPIPPTWPPGEYDRDALEFFRGRLLAGGPSHVGWCGWYAIECHPDGRRERLVGAAGYFGPPSDGGGCYFGVGFFASVRVARRGAVEYRSVRGALVKPVR
jgi:hypothetical protein